jgi:hypothetical protein
MIVELNDGHGASPHDGQQRGDSPSSLEISRAMFERDQQA